MRLWPVCPSRVGGSPCALLSCSSGPPPPDRDGLRTDAVTILYQTKKRLLATPTESRRPYFTNGVPAARRSSQQHTVGFGGMDERGSSLARTASLRPVDT